jgi:hypothetical protein
MYSHFLEKELRGLSPNFHLPLSVSNLCTPRIGPHIFLRQNRQTNPGNIYCTSLTHRHMNVEIGVGTAGRTIPFLGMFVSYSRYCVLLCMLNIKIRLILFVCRLEEGVERAEAQLYSAILEQNTARVQEFQVGEELCS